MGTETIIALLAAIFGGVGLKIIESFLNKSKEKFDIGVQMRQELRDDVVFLREELERIEGSLDEWRKKYYNLLNAFNELSLIARTSGLEKDVDRIKGNMSR